LAATIPQESIATLILFYDDVFATHEADLGSYDRASPSHGPWLSRPLVVPKANGKKRLVVDYRPLNSITTGDLYLMPRADDIFDSLGDASIFTVIGHVIGHKSGFHQINQIPVWEPNIPKTAFASRIGNFEYTKIPLASGGPQPPFNASWTTFWALPSAVLRGFTWMIS
jgi:hypothetical protein